MWCVSDGCSVREAEAGDLGVAAEVRELNRGNATARKRGNPKDSDAHASGRGADGMQATG